EPREGESQTVMRVGRILVRFECPAEQSRCLFQAALLQSNHSQAAKRAEMPVVRAQHLPIELLCLPQPALRVERGGVLKGLHGRKSRKGQRRWSSQGPVPLMLRRG